MWMAVIAGAALGFFLAFQFLLFLFSFSPAVAWMLDKNIVSFLKDVVGPVSAGFGGAIAGAFAAFKLQSIAEQRKELKADARTLYMAKLNLMQKLNDLGSIKKHSMYEYREHPARFILIGELPETPGVREPINPDIIDLLIGAGSESSKLIGVLLLADQRYEACFVNFKARNKALREYRDKVNSSDIGATYSHQLEDVCRIVEPARLIALHLSTEGLIEMFDEAIDTLLRVLNDIGSALDKSFKGKGLSVMTVGKNEGEFFLKLPPPRFNANSLKEFIQRARRT